VDDDGASLDLVHRALEILERVVGKEHIEASAQELEQMLGSDLRTWFRSSFFERHLKRYSKSRRKAPIYWQLGTPTASYSVWLYYQRGHGKWPDSGSTEWPGGELRVSDTNRRRHRRGSPLHA